MLYELAMRMEMTDRNLYSTSLHLLAVGKILKIDPDAMAKMLTGDIKDLQDYGESINKAIDTIREAEKASKPADTAAETPKEEPKA
jgi:hypothetical protein